MNQSYYLRYCIIIISLLFTHITKTYSQQWTSSGDCNPDSPIPIFTMINACGNGSNTEEPASEYYTFATSDAAFDANSGMSLSVECPLGNTNSELTGYSSNPAVIAQLNALTGGCSEAVFIDAMSPPYNGVIPANTVVWAFNTDHPNVSLLDAEAFVGLCSGDPIYVLFGNYSGNLPMFKNNTGCTSCGCIRYINITFGGCTYNIAYDLTQLVDASGDTTDGEGAYIILNPDGTVGYGNNGNCAPLEITCTNPDAPLLSDISQTLCTTQTAQAINCSNCNEYTVWTDDAGSILAEGSSYIPNAWAVGENIIYVQNLNGACSSELTPYALSVLAPPVAQINAPSNACIGQAVELSANVTNNTDYIWTISAPDGSQTSHVAADWGFTPTLAGTYTIALTADNGYCTTDLSTTLMAIDNAPLAQIAPLEAVFCQQDALLLDASASVYSGSQPLLYEWTVVNTSTGTQAIYNNATVSLTNPEAGSYTATLLLTADDACQATTATIDFEVTAPFNLNTNQSCWSPNNYTISGTIVGGAAPYVVNGEQVAGNTFALNFTTPTYTITVSDGSPCAAQSITQVAETCPCASIATPMVPNSSVSLCAGEPLPTFAVQTPNAAYTYTWYNAAGNVVQANSSSFTPTNAGNFTVLATDVNGCNSLPSSVSVQIQPAPLPITVAPLNSYCAGEPIPVLANADAANILVWNCATCPDDGSGTSFAPSMTAAGSYNYTIYQQNNNSCVSAATNFVLQIEDCVLPCPTLLALDAPVSACNGTDVTLTATVSDPNNTLSHLVWIDNTTNTILPYTNLTCSVLGVADGCNPQTHQYTVQLYCTNDTSQVVASQSVSLTYYPTPSATISLTNNGCTLSALPNCADWLVEPPAVTSNIPSLEMQSFTVSNPAAVGLTCSTSSVVGQYNCQSDCFFVIIPANATLSVCDEQYPNLFPIQNNIFVSDPATLFTINWYEDAAMTIPISLATFTHDGNSCNTQTLTIYAGALCTLNLSTPIAAGQVVVTIYPSFDPSLVQTTEGTCGVLPTLSVSCPNYVVDLIEASMPAAVLPGSSGNAVWNIKYAMPSGTSCINQNVNVPYGCATECRNVSLIQSPPTTACSGSNVSMSVSISPLLLPFGVQDSLQWSVNNQPIAGANGTTLNYTLPNTTCNDTVMQFALRYICIVPGNLSEDILVGDVVVHPSYDAANVSVVNGLCSVPTISACDAYNVAAVSVPAVVNGGDSGVATWQITSATGCFTPQNISATYNCPAACPTVVQALSASVSLCAPHVLDAAQLQAYANTITIADPDNTAGIWQWFADAAFTQPILTAPLNHTDACAAQTTNLYVALLCTATNQLLPAGNLTVELFSQPDNELSPAGGCNLAMNPNCANGGIVIQYENAPNVWSAAPPANPTDAQSVAWRAFTIGADWDNDGSPNCFATGVNTASGCACVPPLPPTAVTTQLSFCEGTMNSTPFEVLPSSGSWVVWTDAAGNVLANTPTYTPTTAGSYTAQVFSVADTCAGAMINATLTQTPLPNAAFSYPTDTLCANGANLLPNNIATGGGAFSASNGLNIDAQTGGISANMSGTFTLYYDLTVAGCTAQSSANIVLVNEPSLPILNVGDISICSTETNTQAWQVSNLNAETYYTWTNSAGNVLSSTANYTATAADTYTLTADNDWCNAQQISVELLINPADMAALSYAVGTTVCADTTPLLPTLVGTAGGTYSATNNLTIDEQTGALVPNTAGNYTIYYTTNGVCPATDSTTLAVTDLPIMVNAGSDLSVCEGEAVLLQANISGASSSVWAGANVGNANAAATELLYNQAGTYVLYVTAQNNCQQATDTVVVQILPYIVLQTNADTTIFAGESVTLQANGSATASYTWTPANSLSCSNCPNPTAQPTQTSTYQLSTNEQCYQAASVTITVVLPPDPPVLPPVMLIPNAFSPNNDGQNDVFPILQVGNLTTYHLAIYNRWGQQVFETTQYSQKWDGTWQGREQEVGVYVYYMNYQFEGQNAEFAKGNITLLR